MTRRQNKSAKKRARIALFTITILALAVAATILYFFLVRSAEAPQTPDNREVIRDEKDKPSALDEKMKSLNLREKISRLLILHHSGTDADALQSFASTYQPGGFIFMDDNMPASDTELAHLTRTLRSGDTAFPRLLAVDEEGGTVTRLAADTFAGADTLKTEPVEATAAAFQLRSSLLQQTGFTINFGIVADVTEDPRSFIYPRVLGTSADEASIRVAAAVRASHTKTLSTLKHFPGHGETTANSHNSIPTTDISYDAWRQRDKPPFTAGIEAGADAVMMGHLRYSSVDINPASLSKRWYDILREDAGFKGLIITDDLFMLSSSGEQAYTDVTVNAISALQAGATMLLLVSDHGAAATTIDLAVFLDKLVEAVESGAIPKSSINQKVRLVLEAQAKTASF